MTDQSAPKESIFDNGLPDFMKEHMQRYLATDGADGHIWNGAPTLLLTTKGRKSGKPRMLPLIYQPDDKGNYVIIASRGGDDVHPGWYLNLVAHPEVQVQVMDKKFTARARQSTPEERGPLWSKMCSVWPDYSKYATLTERHIPVVVLEPV